MLILLYNQHKSITKNAFTQLVYKIIYKREKERLYSVCIGVLNSKKKRKKEKKSKQTGE